ncbi:MAG: DNA recombination protein RmuC [uncultured Campylobacterales bacterium]|uniref:DNA recombination protein RmuC n=1 Tax=uncultured Campylobacterales bacterium TaxID=352960 RepID=A0A6S6SPC1_9BACT|nr:MAG: DNA recombination protein RmuC [uncultured Campylobacterales bacterium]
MEIMILSIVLALFIIAFIWSFYLLNKKNVLLTSMNIELSKSQTSLQEQQNSHIQMINEKDNYTNELKKTVSELNTQKASLQESITIDKSLISGLQTKLQEQKLSIDEKIKLFKESENQLKSEFKSLASEVLENNSEKMTKQNEQSLGHILTPMKDQLKDFKQKVEDVYDKEAKDRSALQNELKHLKELNQKMSLETQNLTTALKGQNKTQGSWGEMILEKVLESSGLRINEEYIKEVSLQNDEGDRYRPDVIVNLPNDRQVIIDAKTSLVAYEKYVSSQNDEDKQTYINLHIKSINTHIDSLADKRYEDLKGVNTLDFIFMFVPIESALMIALESDKSLFDKAFKKKIVLVGPSNLLIALKTVEYSWRQEKQIRNIAEVISSVEKLYAKIKNFIDDFDKMGKNITLAQKSYDEAYKKLSTGRGNIVRQIEQIKDKSKIKPKQEISKELSQNATLNTLLDD